VPVHLIKEFRIRTTRRAHFVRQPADYNERYKRANPLHKRKASGYICTCNSRCACEYCKFNGLSPCCFSIACASLLRVSREQFKVNHKRKASGNMYIISKVRTVIKALKMVCDFKRARFCKSTILQRLSLNTKPDFLNYAYVALTFNLKVLQYNMQHKEFHVPPSGELKRLYQGSGVAICTCT
jgi:hypothetical protein